MSNIQIITDSTAYLEKSYCIENNIVVVPLSYVFKGETETEGYPGEFESFFSRLKNSKDFPTTSQPPVGDFKEVFESALKEGSEIIVVTISSKLSGTYNSACLAAEMLDANKISIVDSLQFGTNIAELVKIAVKMSKTKKTRKEIEEELNDQKERMDVRIVPETLDYLRKGGRLSNIASFVGNLINLKPIVGFNEGKLEVVAKTRGFKKAIKFAIKDIPPEAKVINITHVINLDSAVKLKKEVVAQFPNAEVNITEIGPVVGSHNGPGTLGLVYFH
ncbi:MAG: DegV family protein [Clostridiales bacterium]|nr:DegV family protein [Clostridiales bacterium]